MRAPAVELSGLTKTFGEVRALDSVDLTVEEGSVFGFLGPNGAGKTTALRILAGLAHPTGGTARVFGNDVVGATNSARSLIGFLPDVPGFYPWMSAREFLEFSGRLFNLSRDVMEERVEALLALSGLSGTNTRVGGFSRGMRQRLGIAQALVNAPRLLLLDEPTSALDPIGRKEVLDMIAGLGGRTTVFFSTHILSDVERVCDTVAILNRGRVIIKSPIETLKDRHSAHRVVVDVEEGGEVLARAVEDESWAESVTSPGAGRLEVVVEDLPAAQRAIPRLVAEQGLALRRMQVEEASLEDVFVELVEGASR